MASDAPAPSLARERVGAVPLYTRSWVDRFTAWVEALPVPGWMFYLFLVLLQLVLLVVARALGGMNALTSLDPFYLSFVVIDVYFVALIHYLDAEAERALESFRPALGASETEYSRIKFELTMMPALGARLAAAVGILIGILTLVLSQRLLVEEFEVSPASAILLGIILVSGFGMAGVFLYHTLRQLRVVSRIYSIARDINLFHFAPLYAFSGLTARTGIGYILLVYFANALRPQVTLTNPATVGLFGVQLLLAVACFILPLVGMHNRIVKEKERLLSEVNQRIEAMIGELYRRADGLILTDSDKLNPLMASLVTTRDLLAKIPTWPWQPGTLTGFVSALLLPLFLWFITRVLERMILP